MNKFKKYALPEEMLFKGGLKVVPLMSDQQFLSIFGNKIQSIPYP